MLTNGDQKVPPTQPAVVLNFKVLTPLSYTPLPADPLVALSANVGHQRRLNSYIVEHSPYHGKTTVFFYPVTSFD
jgi:hypothetical protein